MLITSSEFVKSAIKPLQYPAESMPEIAFAGRSNVGKSSLINTILNRKRLVKTSSTPGRTQLINFFCINQAVYFVDLPGYGYAKVPQKIKKTWQSMIETYLTTRKTLKGVVVLLDIRRTLQDREIDLLNWLAYHGIAAVPVLTKADKLSKTKRIRAHMEAARILALHQDQLILFSAKTRLGRDALLNQIEGLIT
jgi:GTP-binding protein